MGSAPEEFADLFARGLSERRRTLTWLSDRLRERGVRVGVSTLSSWRAGTRRPERQASLDALPEIEDLLGLEPGVLRGALGPSRRPGRVHGVVDLHHLLKPDVAAGVGEALVALGLSEAFEGVTEETMGVTVDLDEVGRQLVWTFRFRLRATRHDVGAYPFWVVVPDQQHPSAVSAVAGAAVGRRRHVPDLGMTLHELILDVPLRIGDTAVVEVQVDRRPVAPDDDDLEFTLWAPRPTREVEMWVRFAAVVPAVCELRLEPLVGDVDTRYVDTGGSRSVHLVARRFGPGAMTIRWSRTRSTLQDD